jgi:hypothetical protein
MCIKNRYTKSEDVVSLMLNHHFVNELFVETEVNLDLGHCVY